MSDSPMPDLMEPMRGDISGFEQMPTRSDEGGSFSGAPMIVAGPRSITAQKVAVPRNMSKILNELRVYCNAFGDNYVYSWEVNDRRNNRRVTIEGGTVKLANDLVNLYGNCSVDVDVSETKDHWILKAFFIDYERGTCVSRLFQQRKRQDTGMKDAERQADIVFQIGQSKAIRNVVLNALSSLADRAIEDAKRGMIERFQDEAGREKAINFIEKVRNHYGIEMSRIEAVIGRKARDWTARDMAQIWTQCRAIVDGMASPIDTFPSTEDASAIMEEKESERETGKRRAKADDKPAAKADDEKPAKRQAAQKAEPEKAEAKAAEPAPAEKPKPDVKQEEAKANADDMAIPAFLRRDKPAEAEDEAPAAEAEDDDAPDESQELLDDISAEIIGANSVQEIDDIMEGYDEAISNRMSRAYREQLESRAQNMKASMTQKPATRKKADPPPAPESSEDDTDFFGGDS